jgi:hypothetical protein
MKDLKLTAELSDKVSAKIDQIATKLAGLGAKVAAGNAQAVTAVERNAERMRSTQERIERDRIRMQRASIALEERMERQRAAAMERNSRNSLQVTQSRAAAQQRIERQAAVAEASLVLDKFDRRIAIERAKHAQILTDLQGNHAAIEAETRRHQAVVGRIRMDQANFSNTPFQKMLENLNKLNGSLSKVGPTMTTVAGAAGPAGAAMAGFGGALSSLTMGPVGIAILAITGLNAAMNKLIDDADAAANRRANLGTEFKDPAKARAALAIMERYEKAKANRGKAVVQAGPMGGTYDPALGEMAKASRDFEAQFGVMIEKVPEWNAKVLKVQAAAAAKTTDAAKQARKDAQSAQEERWAWEREVREADQRNAEKATKVQEERGRRMAEARARNAEDEAKVQEIYKKREQEKAAAEGKASSALKMAQAGDDPLAKLKVQHAAEIAEAEKAGIALKDIEARHLLERDALKDSLAAKDKERDQKAKIMKLQATSELFGGLAALTAQANMKDKGNRLRWKSMAIAEAGINTWLAASNALATVKPTVPFGIMAAAGVGLKGMAMVNQIKDQKFAQGGPVYGPSHGGGGVRAELEGGEFVLSRGDVRRMGGRQGVEAARQGFTHTGSVTIQVNVPAGTTSRQAEDVGTAVAMGYQAEMRKWKRMERDTEFYGVRP